MTLAVEEMCVAIRKLAGEVSPIDAGYSVNSYAAPRPPFLSASRKLATTALSARPAARAAPSRRPESEFSKALVVSRDGIAI